MTRGEMGRRARRNVVRALPVRVRRAGRELLGRPLPVTRESLAERTLLPNPRSAAPVTNRLLRPLAPEDLQALERCLDGRTRPLWQGADTDEHLRGHLTLALASHHEVEPILRKTGLSAAMPPAEVHAMARGPLAAGGSFGYADMVIDAVLAAGGEEPSPRSSGLDFGCSSGRVVRVLAAAYPGADWHGCDPNTEAVSWAKGNLPSASFTVSPQEPPLHYPSSSFDLVFAISIWSHLAPPAALRWLEEMRRIVRPGGRLVITTHGPHSIAHYAGNGLRPVHQLQEIRRALSSSGSWYAQEFGASGDHGVISYEWGTAFYTPEWLLASTTPAWRVALYAVGRAEGNQDLYVLQRPPEREPGPG